MCAARVKCRAGDRTVGVTASLILMYREIRYRYIEIPTRYRGSPGPGAYHDDISDSVS